MGKELHYDCIEMKRKIQEQMRRDFSGLSDEEERNLMLRELASSDDLAAQKWRAVRKRQKEALAALLETK